MAPVLRLRPQMRYCLRQRICGEAAKGEINTWRSRVFAWRSRADLRVARYLQVAEDARA